MDKEKADRFKQDMTEPNSAVDYLQVGQRIKRLRNQQGMTQEVLAEAASLSVPYISHLERAVKKGSMRPKHSTDIRTVEEMLHVAPTLDKLLNNK